MESYEVAFQIILHAGNSKSHSMLAMQAAREGNNEEYASLIEKAKDELNDAHYIQTNMIQDEASGNVTEVNIIMVHAQDHLTMAFMMKEIAMEMHLMYSRIEKLEKEVGTIEN